MFLHVLKYECKVMLRVRELLFWNLLFPFALATFMYVAFGNIAAATERFRVIPAAVVEEQEDPALTQVLRELSKEGEGRLLDLKETSREEAEKLLREEAVDGVFFAGEDERLLVRGNGMNETVLQMILKQYLQYSSVIKSVASDHPEKMLPALAAIQEGADVILEEKSGEGNQDNMVNYYYAIFAMTCLFASFCSCSSVIYARPRTSVMGQRKAASPLPQVTGVLACFAASWIFQYASCCLLFAYMKFILKIDLGDRYGAIALLLFAGVTFGVMLGVFVGTLPRPGEGGKMGILVAASLFLSFLSDLMATGIRDAIEHTAPVINDINPAALIADSFYALNVYDGYGRFAVNLCTLLGLTAVLAAVDFWLVGRKRSNYAGL